MRTLSIVLSVAFALMVCQSYGFQELQAQFRYLTIYANGDVRLFIVDPSGRRIGYDPMTHKYYEEIPDGNIGAAGIDIVTDEGGEEDPSQVNPIEAAIPVPIDGDYLITVSGRSLRRYYINIWAEQMTGPMTNIADGGIIDSGMVVTFRFTYDYNDHTKSIIQKKVNSATLRQDLASNYKMGKLGDNNFFDELNNHLDKVEKELAQNDSTKAQEKLEEFEKKIDKEREETIKHEQRGQKEKQRFMTKVAYRILKEDVQLLLATLSRKK